MNAATEAAPRLGAASACQALSLSRSTWYRRNARLAAPAANSPRPSPPRALADVERQRVLATFHSDRFIDHAPRQVWATLLDEGTHLCSIRTMYRILEANDESRERRAQRRHVVYEKPELLATAPNQLWSWDITKLHGPTKWTYFHLYVILDVFSRYVVGWMVAHRESAELAERLIAETCDKEGIGRGQLTLHADRGSSMRSKPVALLLADLGITKSHSRPHVSNDNPFSESQFRTLKYRPAFPRQFGSFEDARSHCVRFFDWYNTEHRHSGIGLLTPAVVHGGRAKAVLSNRHAVLSGAYQSHPERFVRHAPRLAEPPQAVWINRPLDSPRSEAKEQ